MSGIEVVGLVLAVLPIIISAAEHVQGGTFSTKRGLKDSLFAEGCKVKLTQQKTLLRLYIQAVVGKTTLSPSTQAALVDDSTSDIWTRPEVIKAISQELGDAYSLFMELLRRVCAALAKHIADSTTQKLSENEIVDLLNDLSLESQKASASTTKTGKLLDRVKLGWKSSERKAILLELEECNHMLEQLLRAVERAKPYEKGQQSRRAHTTFQQREDAHRLFEVLRKACKCNSVEPRDVSLRLQVPSRKIDPALECKFQVLLFDSQRTVCELSARMSKSTEAEPPKKKSRIQFQTSTPSATSNLQTKSMKILGDICKEAKIAQATKCGLQLYVDDQEAVYTDNQKQTVPPSIDFQQLLSLTEVMSKLQIYDHKKWLHREKSILAVTLAYSMLQLHESPWLQTHWNSNNISFVDETDSCNCINERFKLRRPFTRSQVHAVQPSSASSTSTLIIPKPARRNAHLHALGVVLLELYLNRSIQPDVQATGNSDYRGAAQDLLEEHADDITMSAEYHRAISFCLSPKPNPYSGSFSFEDRGFREIFYTEVIGMLEENLTARFEVGEGIWEAD